MLIWQRSFLHILDDHHIRLEARLSAVPWQVAVCLVVEVMPYGGLYGLSAQQHAVPGRLGRSAARRCHPVGGVMGEWKIRWASDRGYGSYCMVQGLASLR